MDVGAYIGKYTVFACKEAEKVIAIEPIPINFVVLRQNVRLNCCERKVFLINKAIDAVRRKVIKHIPLKGGKPGLETASIIQKDSEPGLKIKVLAEPLDDIVQSLGLSSIDFLKIDIEGYVGKALPGMAWSLRNSKYVMIELLRRDLIMHRHLKSLGLRLADKHDSNYLYVRY